MTELELTIYRELKPLHGENMPKHVSNVLRDMECNGCNTENVLSVKCYAVAYLRYVLDCRGLNCLSYEYEMIENNLISEIERLSTLPA